ncbi:DNA-3-methyladenine glycosylase 2 [Delftia sp. PS-11]|uniref:DNA-3-methyladenine glycosylase 2 n=1 Tax=Delftia sp. PS-11 TaxID=2767222 RepID=UPI002455C2AA|nr:DNA-3-methyladenine glycosylase 2 family protein [Delftia sp. PS-11]KAJ8745320.1 DNA-3-methyladenine glycosylase 2 [Delftia sp. PS-11]
MTEPGFPIPTRSPSAGDLRVSQRLALPQDYRMAGFWGFHCRDAQRIAECGLHGGPRPVLHKALAWRGRATLLTLHLPPPGSAVSEVQAHWWLQGAAEAPELQVQAALAAMLRRMFGLGQDVLRFERAHAGHAQLGPLLARQRGLHVPAACTPWEALSWAVTGQQISVAAAVSLRRRLILAANQPVSLQTGDAAMPQQLWCIPEAAQVAAMDDETLRGAGFSQAKSRTLRLLAEAVQAGRLPLDDWAAMPELPAAEIASRLLDIKGVGPWTVNYTLLRGYGYLDGPLHGDAAVRRALAQLLQAKAVDAARTEQWLRDFSPWRALVAAHLWASLSPLAF